MTLSNFQYISLFFIGVTLFLAVNDSVSLTDFPCKSPLQNRNVAQFGYLICRAIGVPWEYNGYGCWCGKGNRGKLVMDETDSCCQVHDKCWDSLEENISGCSPFLKWYSYSRSSDNNIQCSDAVGTCEYGTCLCDKAAVDCFARHRDTSYDPDFDNWQGLCTETATPPESDPDRCPPVWNNYDKYPSGSLVSVHGIKYQSLYSVGPGGNPQDNSYTSNYLGVQATWKKLGPCRRTKDKFTPLRGSSRNIHPNARWQQNGITVAGGNENGNGTDQLGLPLNLYVDNNQTIYVADARNHRIMEWKNGATSGRVVAGGNGVGNRTDQLSFPVDVIVDEQSDSLIICDSDNRRVVRWPRQGGSNGEIIIPNIFCYGLTMDKNGSLYVVDPMKRSVERYRRGESQATVVAGGNGGGKRLDQLSGPQMVFVDQDNSVYVTECGNHRVTKWVEGAKEGMVVAGGEEVEEDSFPQLQCPSGVVVDQLGTVYAAKRYDCEITRWPRGVTLGSVIGANKGWGSESDQLNYPFGLSFDRQGNLYVADSSNFRIQKFNIYSNA